MKYIILGTLAKNHNTKKDTLFKDCAPKRPNSILRHISLYSLNMRLPHKNKQKQTNKTLASSKHIMPSARLLQALFIPFSCFID